MTEGAQRPKVSVCVVTYNQERYIGPCLDSVLSQEAPFLYEVIVGEDCSTDSTRSIVEDYARRYPGIVKPLLRPSNVGAFANFRSVHAAAVGDYVCHLDGDDLWDPGKLVAQAEVLDREPGCVAVWHRMRHFSDDGALDQVADWDAAHAVDLARITQADLLRYGTLGGHSSLMYRRTAAPRFQDLSGQVLDFYVAVELLGHGYGVNLPQVLGGYRYNPTQRTLFWNNGEVCRRLYASHLAHFLALKPEHATDIFCRSFANFIVDVRHGQRTCLAFLPVVARSFSLRGVPVLARHLAELRRIRKQRLSR